MLVSIVPPHYQLCFVNISIIPFIINTKYSNSFILKGFFYSFGGKDGFSGNSNSHFYKHLFINVPPYSSNVLSHMYRIVSMIKNIINKTKIRMRGACSSDGIINTQILLINRLFLVHFHKRAFSP